MSDQYLKFVIALIFVLALLYGVVWVLKRMGVGQGNVSPTKRRLKILEIRPIDHKRRLVLIQRDDAEHLLLVGSNDQTVIETNIQTPKKPKEPKKKA